jgi:type I restriction enzyme, S subunit
LIQYRKLKDLILENKKSNLQVRSSTDLGSYIFFTSGEKTRRSDKKLVAGENIYLATGGKAYVQYYKGNASFSTDCYSITAVKTLAECKYLYYFLISIIDKINEEMFEGAALKHLQKKKLLNCELLLPPLSIQQKIVAKLDKIFAEIDKAIAAAEANVKNAEVLFKNYLTEVFDNYEYDNFLDKTISEVCSKVTDGKHGDCTNEDNSGYYFLSAKDIKNGVLNYKKARQITKADFEETHRRTNLEVGDILLTNSGTIGRMAIALNQTETTRTTFQKSVAIIKPIKNQVYSKFLFYLLSSKLVHFNNLSAGAAQKNLLLRDIRSLKIKIPKTIEEQIKKTDKCDFMYEQIIKFSNNYLEKLENFKKLKLSILSLAFNGELVKTA